MYNRDAEILFPARLIPALRDLRGETWRSLVDRASSGGPSSRECLAFVLLMARLSACSTCHADSYRAARGCFYCASQAVRHYRGGDQDLVNLFWQAHQEIEKNLGDIQLFS